MIGLMIYINMAALETLLDFTLWTENTLLETRKAHQFCYSLLEHLEIKRHLIKEHHAAP